MKTTIFRRLVPLLYIWPLPLLVYGDVSKDISCLNIASSFYLDNVVKVVIKDPNGKSVGIDPDGKNLQEIPKSASFIDSLDNDETGEEATTAVQQIQIKGVTKGMYHLIVSGLANSHYEISITSFAVDGTDQTPRPCITGALSTKGIISYVIEVDPSPGGHLKLFDRQGRDITNLALCNQ